MGKSIERSVIGELVMSLTEDGFRIEFCSQDGGGLYMYAAPDGGQKPKDGWKYWLRLVEGNGADIISDYSVNLEPYLKSSLLLGEQLDAVA